VRLALDLPNFPPLGTPEAVRELAAEAAPAWEGLFLWDHLLPLDGADRVHDTWKLLEVAAEANERLVVGPMIVALGRREAPAVAERARALEAAAPGRVVVGFGTGNGRDLRAAGVCLPDGELRALVAERAAELRAALPASIPLWTSGAWPPKPGGLLGAGVATGAFPIALGGERGYGPPPPEEIAAVRRQVGVDGVVAFTGRTAARGPSALADYAAGGLDWWLEDLYRATPGRALETARRGPGAYVVGSG
jgi:alkanesulfonate monooxygenase SsuD/methylene tetrahydromethanopterin reductase-like flavin-dependent oxidoreductase (luciferase family)